MRTGERLEMPDGSTMIVTKSLSDTSGKAFELEMVLPPHAPPIPEHIHPTCHETYIVLEGTFQLKLDGTWRTLQAGDRVEVPPGTRHTFRNTSDGTVRVSSVHAPPSGFDVYMARLKVLVDTEKVSNLRSPRTLAYLSMLWGESRDAFYASHPVQRTMMAVMAGIARTLGARLERAPTPLGSESSAP